MEDGLIQLIITLILTKLVTLGTQRQAHGMKKMSVSLDLKQKTPGHLQEGREHTLLVAMAGGMPIRMAIILRDGKIHIKLNF